MSELKPETFDLLGAIAGITYPEHEVKVYLNESVGFAVYTLDQALNLAISTGETEKAEEIQKELDDYLEEIRDQALTVKLRGIPEQTRLDVLYDVEQAFPTKKDFLGQPEPNPKGDNMLRRELWGRYITQIVAPNGAVSLPGEAEIMALIHHGGSTLIEQIDSGIGELVTGTRSGFETQAKNLDFLSDASQEVSEEG